MSDIPDILILTQPIAPGALRELVGANYYPGRGPDGCIEYTSLINMRPSQDNPSMEVLDDTRREEIREITFRLLGRGEALR